MMGAVLCAGLLFLGIAMGLCWAIATSAPKLPPEEQPGMEAAARATQAAFMALRDARSHAECVELYIELRSRPTYAVMAPECLDPAFEGGWAWWAQRILDAAGRAEVKAAAAARVGGAGNGALAPPGSLSLS